MSRNSSEFKHKANGSHVGTFFFGALIGILVGIAILAGLVAFAYYKVSPNWLNNNFKTEIDLGNDDLNNLTLSEFVNHAVNLGQNIDTYTLNDLKKDFGVDIGNEFMGINITDLYDVPLPNLVNSIKDKISNISADELKEIINLDDMNNMLDKYKRYYVDAQNSVLYEDENLLEEVDFIYYINNGYVVINNREFAINQNSVNIQLRYLPLAEAMSSLTSNLGANITLRELEQDYGVVLPDCFDSINRNTTIAELGQAIDNMYIADLLGLNYDASQDKVYDSQGTEITGILRAVSRLTVGMAEDGVVDFMAIDMFTTEELSSGVLSLIEPDTKISQLNEALSVALQTATIDELISRGVVTAPSNYNDIKDKYINLDGEYVQVSSLVLDDLIDVAFDLLADSGLLVDQIPTT